MSDIAAPAGVSREEFLRRLEKSDLSTVSEVRRVVEESPDADGTAVRQKLIDQGLLTRFQIDAIAAGRFGDLRIGNYDVLDRLGAGGMGTVFKARHRRMKRIVALKTLSAEVAKSPRFSERFQREVETVARLTHPNIVMAYDADESEGVPFLVMEFVDGRDLSAEVQQSGPLSTAVAVDYLLQSARGLECAHAQGIVHRDIKPGNLLKDLNGVVKVADLGLARLTSAGDTADRALTMAGAVIGTLDFMAPEQALDAASTDHRADVYSLGCTLYFLLTGEPVYRATSLMGLLLAHREAPIPSLRTHRQDVPLDLDALFQAMVAKSPKDRPAGMEEIAQRLETLAHSGLLSNDSPLLKTDSAAGDIDVFGKTMAQEETGEDSSFALGPSSNTAATGDFTTALNVLIVEPSRVQAGIVKKQLATLGMPEPHTAPSGQAAVAAAKAAAIDVVMSALHLDDMSGPQLAAVLFADPLTAGVGFVLATSATDAETASQGTNLDPRIVVLHKPFDRHQLFEALLGAAGRQPTT